MFNRMVIEFGPLRLENLLISLKTVHCVQAGLKNRTLNYNWVKFQSPLTESGNGAQHRDRTHLWSGLQRHTGSGSRTLRSQAVPLKLCPPGMPSVHHSSPGTQSLSAVPPDGRDKPHHRRNSEGLRCSQGRLGYYYVFDWNGSETS